MHYLSLSQIRQNGKMHFKAFFPMLSLSQANLVNWDKNLKNWDRVRGTPPLKNSVGHYRIRLICSVVPCHLLKWEVLQVVVGVPLLVLWLVQELELLKEPLNNDQHTRRNFKKQQHPKLPNKQSIIDCYLKKNYCIRMLLLFLVVWKSITLSMIWILI